MSQTSQERRDPRLFLRIAIASALALIVLFPPKLFVDSLSVYQNYYGSLGEQSVKDQWLIWFAPTFSGGVIVTHLWLAEFAVWGAISAALFAVSRRREFNSRLATRFLIGAFLVSVAIPTKTIGYNNHFRGAYVYNHDVVESESQGQLVYGRLDDAFIREDSGRASQASRFSVSESLETIWDGPATEPFIHPVKEYVFNSIFSGRVGPGVFFTWVIGTFLAAFTGFLAEELRHEIATINISNLLFSFEGRISRAQWWGYVVINILVCEFLLLIGILFFNSFVPPLAYALIMVYPTLAINAKRCHDRGRNGWFMLVAFVPILGLWYLAEAGFLSGTTAAKATGADPSFK